MREAQDTNQEVGVCVHHHLCQQSGGCATVQGRWVGTNSSPGCHLDHCHLSDGEACVLSASGPGAIVSSVTVRVSFSGGQTRYNPPVNIRS